MQRRALLKLSLLAGASAASMHTSAAPAEKPTDGTPAQFLPKKAADTAPQDNDIEKYPKCPYCGMDRRYNHRARMLIHYGNDVPDPLCSIHCAAISLALNLTLDPKAIYVGDNAVESDPRPLVEVGQATFLVGSDLPGVMTRNSKVAYGSAAAARAAQKEHGGQLADFRQTLRIAFTDLAEDVEMIRQGREERRKRAARKAAAQEGRGNE
jgi:nitrous oxide reductase accessory protein NosL